MQVQIPVLKLPETGEKINDVILPLFEVFSADFQKALSMASKLDENDGRTLMGRLSDAMLHARSTCTATTGLTAFTRRRVFMTLDALDLALAETSQRRFPRKRFQFHARKLYATAQAENEVVKETKATETGFVIADLKNQVINVSEQDVANGDLTLRDLEDCTIICTAPCAALWIYRLLRCKVFVAAVSGAAHIEYVKDSSLVFSVHQLRIHHAHNVFLGLFCAADPICENCSDLRVGPFSPPVSIDSNVILAAGLGTNNHSECMHDFSWLRTQASPNWRLVSESEW